jgi:hypothetical protein
MSRFLWSPKSRYTIQNFSDFLQDSKQPILNKLGEALLSVDHTVLRDYLITSYVVCTARINCYELINVWLPIPMAASPKA